MLRVVGLQRHDAADQEFLLLQNQGHMRLNLRSHLVMSESALNAKALDDSIYVFPDDEDIGPGLFVLLTTGHGQPAWSRTRDGAYVFHTYMNRDSSIWIACECPIHVMAPHHSYVERGNRMEYLVAK